LNLEEQRWFGETIGKLGMETASISRAIQSLPESAEVDFAHNCLLNIRNILMEMEERLGDAEADLIKTRNRELYGVSRDTCGHPYEDRI
jgi:hypothetical protein